MTGLRNQFSVARCCCGCVDCCNGSFADEFDVTLSFGYDSEAIFGSDRSCTDAECIALGGTFTLAKLSEFNCTWRYLSGTMSHPCQAPYESPIIRRDVYLQILCKQNTTAEQYNIAVWVEVERQNPIPVCTGLLPWVQRWYWRKTVNVADFSCVTADSVAVPTTGGSDWFRPFTSGVCSPFPWLPFLQVSYAFDWLCDPRDDAIITAVP